LTQHGPPHAQWGMCAQGLNGAEWRTADIILANLLLARTWGHAWGVDHPLFAGVHRPHLSGAV
jgi:hypothetical protein